MELGLVERRLKPFSHRNCYTITMKNLWYFNLKKIISIINRYFIKRILQKWRFLSQLGCNFKRKMSENKPLNDTEPWTSIQNRDTEDKTQWNIKLPLIHHSAVLYLKWEMLSSCPQCRNVFLTSGIESSNQLWPCFPALLTSHQHIKSCRMFFPYGSGKKVCLSNCNSSPFLVSSRLICTCDVCCLHLIHL